MTATQKPKSKIAPRSRDEAKILRAITLEAIEEIKAQLDDPTRQTFLGAEAYIRWHYTARKALKAKRLDLLALNEYLRVTGAEIQAANAQQKPSRIAKHRERLQKAMNSLSNITDPCDPKQLLLAAKGLLLRLREEGVELNVEEEGLISLISSYVDADPWLAKEAEERRALLGEEG